MPLRSGVLDLDHHVEDTGRQIVDTKVKNCKCMFGMQLHRCVSWYLHDVLLCPKFRPHVFGDLICYPVFSF